MARLNEGFVMRPFATNQSLSSKGWTARLGIALVMSLVSVLAAVAASASAATLTLPPVAGYHWTAAPKEFNSFQSSLTATGLVTAVLLKGASDKKNVVQYVAMEAQYKKSIAAATDKTPLKKLLDGGVRGIQAMVGSNTKATDYAIAGTHVREVTVNGISIVVTFLKGGKILEIFGPTAKGTLNFSKAFLLSAKAHGQKLM